MIEEEKRQAYYRFIQDELNNFKDIPLDQAPGPVKLAIEKLMEYDTRDATVQSESIGDLSQTFHELEGLPSDVLSLLQPYRRVKW